MIAKGDQLLILVVYYSECIKKQGKIYAFLSTAERNSLQEMNLQFLNKERKSGQLIYGIADG